MLWYGNFMIKPSFHVLGGLQRWQFRAAFSAAMDRGRPSVKNPIDLIRSVVRRSNRSISRSRSRSPPKPSNTYQIYHSHSTSNNFNHPPLYIQINIDNSGAIIRPSAETIPGVALCSCQHSTNVNLAKQIFFCCKPTLLESLTEEEHLVAGNFLIPYISSLSYTCAA